MVFAPRIPGPVGGAVSLPRCVPLAAAAVLYHFAAVLEQLAFFAAFLPPFSYVSTLPRFFKEGRALLDKLATLLLADVFTDFDRFLLALLCVVRNIFAATFIFALVLATLSSLKHTVASGVFFGDALALLSPVGIGIAFRAKVAIPTAVFGQPVHTGASLVYDGIFTTTSPHHSVAVALSYPSRVSVTFANVSFVRPALTYPADV